MRWGKGIGPRPKARGGAEWRRRGEGRRGAQAADAVKTARQRAASASERACVLTAAHRGGGAPQTSAGQIGRELE